MKGKWDHYGEKVAKINYTVYLGKKVRSGSGTIIPDSDPN
jgi:hypothetical protein